MRRFLRRLLSALLVVLLVLLGTLGWLAGTESGLQVLWQRLLAPALPALLIGSVQGRLADSIRLADVHFENEQLVFSARSLQLDWSPATLLEGLVRITALTAEGVQYQQRGAGSDEPVSLPEHLQLPLAIEVQDLSLRELVVIPAPQAEPLPFAAITLAATWRGTELKLSRFSVQRPALAVSGECTLQTAAEFPLAGTIHWQAELPEYAPLQADAHLSGSLQALRIEQSVAPPYALQLDLTLHELLTALQVDATLVMQDTGVAAINATWPDMHLSGSITAHGPPDALQLDGTLDIRDAMAGAVQLVFASKLLPEALQFDALQLTSTGRPVRLDAQGSIGFGAQPEFDFQAQWQALAWPLDGVADYQSRQGQVTLRGTPDHYRIDAQGDVQWLDLLSGQLALRVRSSDTPGNWQVETASLTGGKARVEASGQVGTAYALDWQIDAAHLADLSPQAAGSLKANGTLRGTLPELAIVARASGSGIDFLDYHLGELELDGDIHLAPDQSSRLRAAIGKARLAGTQIARVELDASGTNAKHRAHLVAESEQGNAELSVTGRWDGAKWWFDLQQASLGYPELAPWQLAEPVSGQLDKDRLQLPEHCWNSAPARVCLQLAGSVSEYSGAVTLSHLPLGYFAALLPEAVQLEGELSGRGEFSADARHAAVLKLQLDTTPVRLGLPEEEDAVLQHMFSFAPGQVVITRQDKQAALLIDLPLDAGTGGVQVQAGLTAPAGGDWLQAALQGDLTLHWPEIGLIRHWIPEVGKLHGQIDGRVALDGTLASPRLQGRLALTQATATLTTPGVELEDVSITLDGQPSGDIQIEAQARSGGGTLRGHGLLNPEQRSASLQLDGKDFQVMNLPEAKIFASPNLQINMTATQASIAGQIDIPRAHLRPTRPPPSAVSVSADQVIVLEGGVKEPTAGFAVDSRVRIVLGDAVDIEGLGLSGKLHGNVLVTDPPGQPATATGELSIGDGRYEAYGQQLSITTGRLLFAGGAVTEPGLDIEAVRKPDPAIKVGIRARGSLRAPEFKVFSDPVMSQSAALSWLVLGRPLQGGASDSERSALQSAALMLGLNRGELVGKSLGESLGLDEVSISQEPGADTTQASLLVGKYLTPELFVSYGIGLFESASTLRMRYALSSRWKLVGATDALSSSADLFYEIEKRK